MTQGDAAPQFKVGQTVYVMDWCPYAGAYEAQIVERADAGKWRVAYGHRDDRRFRDVRASDLQPTIGDAAREFEVRRDAIAQGFRRDADEIASKTFRLATEDEIYDMPGELG